MTWSQKKWATYLSRIFNSLTLSLMSTDLTIISTPQLNLEPWRSWNMSSKRRISKWFSKLGWRLHWKTKYYLRWGVPNSRVITAQKLISQDIPLVFGIRLLSDILFEVGISFRILISKGLVIYTSASAIAVIRYSLYRVRSQKVGS